MPQIARPKHFDKQFRKKPPDQQAALAKALKLLGDNPSHPSLRVKRVKSAPGVFEASANMRDRLTFEWVGGQIVLRNNCHHDEVLKRRP